MRPVVQLHTLDQWLTLDRSVRTLLLQHIKLADRLKYWLKTRSEAPRDALAQPVWVPCTRCNKKGWVLKEPRYPGIHPSQLVSECLLKIYWQMEGKPEREKHEARAILTFDIGHAVHHMLQGYGQQGAWGTGQYTPEQRLTGSKQPVADDLMIEGSADADTILVIDDIPNAPIYEVGVVHEYKTMKSEIFQKLTRPKPEHKIQATIYTKVLNRPVTGFLYVSKNDSNLADYPVEFDATVWAPIEAKARLLVQYYEREEPPPAAPGFHCQQCPFAYDCDAYRTYSRRGPTTAGVR
jgi:CRISPR/Cas system-associated exonuclease Cas4 (RecB family)